MTFLEPVRTQSDTGTSSHLSGEGHSHSLFDVGLELELLSPWVHEYAGKPLRLYKGADWVIVDGIIRWPNAASLVEEPIAVIPNEYLPDPVGVVETPTNDTMLFPASFFPAFGYATAGCTIEDLTSELRCDRPQLNQIIYFTDEWRTS